MQKKHWIGLLLIVIAVVGVITAVGQRGENEIRIGSILILSGDGASWGEASKNGTDLAVADVNAGGGIEGKRLVVTHEDNGSYAKQSVSAFNKLTDSGINYIIGPNWSTFGLPLVNLAKTKKTVIISPSLGLKDFNEANEYLFNTWPHDETLSRLLADAVFKAGHRRVAIFGVQDVWNKAQTQFFIERFKELGGDVAFLNEPTPTDKDARGAIAKMKTVGSVDAIIMTNSGFSGFATTVRQLKELGVTLPLYSLTIDQQNLSDCGAACEGLNYLTFLTPSKAFEIRYKAIYNREVEIGADSAYDAVMMLAQAMRATHSTDTTVVAKYLAGIKEYEGVSGHLISDGKRAFTKPYKVMQVVHGVPVEVTK